MFLTLDQAAARAGLKTWTLRHWRWRASRGLELHEQGRAFVRIVKRLGRSLRVDEEDLNAWLRQQSTASLPVNLNNLRSDLIALQRRFSAVGQRDVADLLGIATRMIA